MKKAIIIIVIVLSCWHVNAQVFTGVIYDKATKQPIPDVYVYLDGTAIYTQTDDSGKFELKVNKVLNTRLVLQHLLYNTVIIKNPFENLPTEFFMQEQLNILDEAIVRASRFSRKQKLKAFKEQFLGETIAGRSCKIKNEDDIELWYDLQTKTLFASSNRPIEVFNKYLGYTVLFNLVEFRTDYSSVTLNSDAVRKNFFAVTTSFIDITPIDRKIKNRRDDTYKASATFFFKNFVNNTLKEAGFKIYKDEYRVDHNLYFITEDILSSKMIQLISVQENMDSDELPLFSFSVLYNGKQSDIHFYTDYLIIDTYGHIDKIDKVHFTGYLGQCRAGNMLPFEYEP